MSPRGHRRRRVQRRIRNHRSVRNRERRHRQPCGSRRGPQRLLLRDVGQFPSGLALRYPSYSAHAASSFNVGGTTDGVFKMWMWVNPTGALPSTAPSPRHHRAITATHGPDPTHGPPAPGPPLRAGPNPGHPPLGGSNFYWEKRRADFRLESFSGSLRFEFQIQAALPDGLGSRTRTEVLAGGG